MSILTTTLILTVLGYGGSGTAVFPLLKIGQGPRAAAMGESFIGLADDATAVYWTPAGLSQLKRYEFGHLPPDGFNLPGSLRYFRYSYLYF